ncbi:hypothetical protein QR98_0060760 [Sarcoptes scabiei]|uniref:Acyltransferase 3 domain-containing protein n=1 Tax=Sarcoptes scabiei TaxID=52283 RepID=A0A132A9M4_SARSC|nr:hypothetical protein QR98_0060760 [Sarcoptes scabiei]
MLITYSTLRTLEQNQGRFNYLKYLLNMYLRFYPSVFGAILFYYLLPLFGDGPFWYLVDRYHVEACRKQLWSSLLTYNFYEINLDDFIQNSICNISSWWVNSCFHLILFSPLILVPLYRLRSSTSLVVMFLTIIGGCFVSINHIAHKGVPYMNQLSRMESIFEDSFYSIFYTWPFYHHISTFALGMLVGFLIRRYPNLYLGGRFGESLLSIIFLTLTFYGFVWTGEMLSSKSNFFETINESRTNLEIFLNVSVGKLMFCSGFLWIFYFCCTRPKSFWSRLFSIQSLQPFYGLSLGLYLINFLPPLWTVFSTKELIDFDDYFIMKNSAFNFTMTVVLAYLINVLFERPVLNLMKLFG